jgi:histidyl-tRNA synthetase
MPSFRAPRGTRDLLPEVSSGLNRLEGIARSLAGRYGYREMETPMFEQTAVFERGIGEVTDVVEKELFRLAARTEDAEAWALRPEATAGIVRAFVQHGMQTWPQPVKLTVVGPMFRYDRPQAGRYRQFWQWDAEAIGDPGPAVDAEMVEMGYRFYVEAGVSDVQVLLNSIGDGMPAGRPTWSGSRTTFRATRRTLPELERRRLDTNPLRLLDSKDPAMAASIAAAPKIGDCLCEACAAHFAAVWPTSTPWASRTGWSRHWCAVSTTTPDRLRVLPPGRRGAAAGARRRRPVRRPGGAARRARHARHRFRVGLDRVLLALEESGAAPASETPPLAVVVGADPADTVTRLRVASMLRAEGLSVRAELAPRKLGRQLETASRDHAHFAVIIGDELTEGNVQFKDLEAGTQRLVPLAELARELARAAKSHHHG